MGTDTPDTFIKSPAFRAFVGLLLTVSEPTTTERDLLCHAVSVDKEHHDLRHAGGMPQRAAGTQPCATH